jgi:hypothetical protein
MTDDEQGRLVLTKAGSDSAHDALLQGPGGNVQWASAVLSGARRFSHYKVRRNRRCMAPLANVELVPH